jgi:hypothetical protein
MLQKTLFIKVIFRGIIGAIAGIGAGLLLGLFIWGLDAAVAVIDGAISQIPCHYSYGNLVCGNSLPPAEVVAMLGMGFGALIGSVSGVLTSFGKDQNPKPSRTKQS